MSGLSSVPGLLAGRSTGLVRPGYTEQQLTAWAVGRLGLSSHNSLDISQHSSHITSIALDPEEGRYHHRRDLQTATSPNHRCQEALGEAARTPPL